MIPDYEKFFFDISCPNRFRNMQVEADTTMQGMSKSGQIFIFQLTGYEEGIGKNNPNEDELLKKGKEREERQTSNIFIKSNEQYYEEYRDREVSGYKKGG